MKIFKFIKAARRSDACKEALTWAIRHPYADEYDLARKNPCWYIWACGMIPGWPINSKLLRACVLGKPTLASVYTVKHLTKRTLDSCARTSPWYALVHATGLLTKKNSKWCWDHV